MPCSASFGRSSVQAASGAQTPFVNFYVGIQDLNDYVFNLKSITLVYCTFEIRRANPALTWILDAHSGLHSQINPCCCHHHIGYLYV